MEDLEALLCLNMIKGLGPVKIRRLIEHFKKPKDILSAGVNKLRNVEGIDEILAGSIRSHSKEVPLEKELKLIKELGLRILSILDDGYPKNLKETYDPPVIIYVKGIIKKEDDLSISIVGTRQPSYYGLSQAEKFSYVLASRGITVVSGMARGVDSASHKGALKAGGRTIAVLGSGLGIIYPSENRELFERISANGAVISEFPIKTPPNRENFPRRNRIISGLSLGTLVVEAAKNSGSLITARFALEQNREVFALPGNVSSSGSIGTNKLIKEGAKLVEGIEDIIEEIEPFRKLVEKKKANKETGPDFSALDIKERLFVKALSNDNPAHLDQIIADLNLPAGELIALAARLELRGLIKQLPGKFFVCTR